MKRLLALDYGHKRIGVALSDPLQIIAQPYDTWQNLSVEDVIERLSDLIRTKDVQLIVLGYPLTLKGDRKKLARQVEYFRLQLCCHINVPVILWDERLTSVQAKKTMITMNEKPSHNKAKIDQIAASLLLQNYIDARKKHTNSEESD